MFGNLNQKWSVIIFKSDQKNTLTRIKNFKY